MAALPPTLPRLGGQVRPEFAVMEALRVTGGLAPAARFASYRGPCPRGSLRDRSPAAFGGLAPLAARFATALVTGGLAPAARFATAPPPASAGSLRSRLASRPLPRRLRRARSARGSL